MRGRVRWFFLGDWERGKKRHPAPPADYIEEAARQQRLFDRLLEHSASIASIAVFAFVVIKVVVIAGGNTITAAGLVQAAGPLQVLAGVTVLSISAIGVGLTNFVLVAADNDRAMSPFDRRWRWIAFLLLAFATSLVVSWVTTVLLLVFAAFLIYRWWRSGYSLKPPLDAAEPARVDFKKWLELTPNDVVLRQHHTAYKVAYERKKALRETEGDSSGEIAALEATLESEH